MGRKYDENTIYEIARRIVTGEISYSQAQKEYSIKSQGSIGPWIRKYKAGLLPCYQMGKYDKLSKERLIKQLEEIEASLQRSRLESKAYSTLIEVAEEKFKIEIRKKYGTKQFSDSENKK